MRRLVAMLCALGAAGALAGHAGAAPGRDEGAPAAAGAPPGAPAVTFEPNHGQFDPQVRFLARSRGLETFLTADGGATFVVPDERRPDRGVALEMRLVAGGAGVPQPSERREGVVSYFRGSDPAGWHTGIPTFGRVRVAGVYPGVDLDWRADATGALEYDFVVRPGASPGAIALAFDGAKRVRATKSGDLELHTDAGTVTMAKPVVYEADGTPVSAAYDVRGTTVGFALGAYDATETLVIDPVVTSQLAYSTLFGGGGIDVGNELAIDGAGNTYLAGTTSSTLFPTTPGAFDRSPAAMDVFAAKLSAAGTLVYSTVLGGTGTEDLHGLSVDAGGRAYLAGMTASSAFPVTAGAFDTTPNGLSDAFVVKLDAAGSALAFSTLLGGGGDDIARALALDASERPLVAVTTTDAPTDYPTTAGSFDLTHNGLQDVAVTQLSANGSSLVYSTFLGGDGGETGRGVAIDSAGNAVVVGNSSPGATAPFPTTAGAFQAGPSGANDAFVAKLNAAGSSLLASTLFGGESTDIGHGVALDANDAVYLGGQTSSTALPVASAFDATHNGSADAFVAKLAPSLSNVTYSTYLGGLGFDGDFGVGITVDAVGSAYVTSNTTSPGFPVTAGAFDATHNGSDDVFLTKLSPAGNLLRLSTFVGSSVGDVPGDVALDESGNVYLMGGGGESVSAPFPTTADALQPESNGSTDAFLVKFGDFSISGRIVDENGAPASGMQVAMSGPASATVTTDAQGRFAFLDTVVGGDFVVAPEDKRANPSSVAIQDLAGNYGLAFIVGFQAPFGEPGGVDGTKP